MAIWHGRVAAKDENSEVGLPNQIVQQSELKKAVPLSRGASYRNDARQRSWHLLQSGVRRQTDKLSVEILSV
jgi:hypothetical protein